MSRECLFCGAAGPRILTNEDVSPVWLLKHLDLSGDDLFFQGVASSATGKLLQRLIHASWSFNQGSVCSTCNNGWMTGLESAAKPILEPLIDKRRPLLGLAPAEAAIVGKWG